MHWFSPISVLYSILRTYVQTIYSILNHVVIPLNHKSFVTSVEGNYDLQVYSRDLRRASFTNAEKEILLQLVENEKNIIDVVTVDANSLCKKRQAWERIGKEFNSYEDTTKRTVYQLRGWWTNHRKQTSKLQHKQISYEQVADGIANNVINPDISENNEIVLANAEIDNSDEQSEDFSSMDKSAKSRKNVEKLCDLHSDDEVVAKSPKMHEKQLQDLQLREIEKRYEIIQEESKIKLEILKMQLRQEQLKTMQAERDLEVQKQKNAILDLDIKQKKMDIEMREHLFKEKQLKARNNKHNAS